MKSPADQLRERGIAVTAQRLAVMRALGTHPHGTADAIAEEARQHLGAISRQAVYDILGMLVTEGLIRRIQPAGSPALYEDRIDDNHHHLICRSCGKTEDVECAAGKSPCLHTKHPTGFVIDEAEIIFWGTCPDCRRAAKSK